jgi:hypothetical protein
MLVKGKNASKIMSMKWNVLAIAYFCCTPALADDCKIDWWKRIYINDSEAVYYGSVEPGTAKSIFVEVWGNDGLAGEAGSYVNPRGTFSVTLISLPERDFKKRYKPTFSCSTDIFFGRKQRILHSPF